MSIVKKNISDKKLAASEVGKDNRSSIVYSAGDQTVRLWFSRLGKGLSLHTDTVLLVLRALPLSYMFENCMTQLDWQDRS